MIEVITLKSPIFHKILLFYDERGMPHSSTPVGPIAWSEITAISIKNRMESLSESMETGKVGEMLSPGGTSLFLEIRATGEAIKKAMDGNRIRINASKLAIKEEKFNQIVADLITEWKKHIS